MGKSLSRKGRSGTRELGERYEEGVIERYRGGWGWGVREYSRGGYH